MNSKSLVLRILYYSDRHGIDGGARLNTMVYLTSNEMDVDIDFEKEYQKGQGKEPKIQSDELKNIVGELQNYGLVDVNEYHTMGDDEVRSCYLTEKGVERSENLITESETEKRIEQQVSEKNDIPMSNLIHNIRDSEPAHEWS